MKKSFIFSLALAAGMSAFAATSPFEGSVPEHGKKYYLYQVETGRWLQANMSKMDSWTTHGELGEIGLDVETRKLDGFTGFQIYVDFTNNGELNGSDEDRFYFDQGDRALTDWIFEPANVDGVVNGYKIMVKAKNAEGTRGRDYIDHDTYIGANSTGDFGGLASDPEFTTWQLVSREERLAKTLVNVSEGNPVDVSWLIPWNDLGRNDRRADRWTKTVNNPSGGGLGHDGSQGYPVQEYWHNITMRKSITLTDLPAGTYSFSVQAYYREDHNDGYYERRKNGEEVIRANYFAGATSAKVKSIFDDAKTVQGNGFERHVELLGLYVPDAMDQASRAMFNGNYINEFIKAPVDESGELTIGIEKPEAQERDWFVEKRYFLHYESAEVMAEDLTPLKEQLSELLAEASELPETPALLEAMEAATYALESATTAKELLDAIEALRTVVNGVKDAKGLIDAFNKTLDITNELGIDAGEAIEQFNNANTRGDYETALRTLRYARRVAVAEKHNDVFEGNEPAEGNFYIYNVGRQQFLQGGADWGAHAALGFTGTEIELKKQSLNNNGDQKYLFDTKLNNGGERQFLNYRGYMDADPVDGWVFVPVEGKTNTYYIVQGDYTDVHVQWNPYASVDAGNADETTVGTECRNLDPTDLTAQWKLVTRAEREALLEDASLENPVDATVFIKSAGFNQREDVSAWSMASFNIWDRGGNHYDFACESWNSDAGAELRQEIAGLPAGIYQVSVQGFYRNGSFGHDNIDGTPCVGQANLPVVQNAVLYAGEDSADDVLLPSIVAESGNAPGEGDTVIADDNSVTYELPNGIVHATNYFKSGLYKAYTVVEVGEDGELAIGVYKESRGDEPGDWIVVDNFRLTYYGNETTKEEVKDGIQTGVESIEIVRPADNRIFNLHGIEVKNPTAPGIYIQNGKKFIVK